MSRDAISTHSRIFVGIDWEDLRVFHYVANHGTMAAADLLKMDVTTVRRRIASLEKSVGMRLMVKSGRGLTLTADGERIHAKVAVMDELGREIATGATDAIRDVEGVIRISTMEGFGSSFLAPRLGEFTAHHPRVSVQLVTAPHILNLADREADLSINMVQPKQGRLVVRKLAQFGIGLYAAPSYLEQMGMPATVHALASHRFVTYVDELIQVPHVKWLLDIVQSPVASFSSTSLAAQLEAARGGAGLVMLPHFMVHRHSGLVRVLGSQIDLVRDWWLVVHQDLQRVPRIRAAIDFVASVMERDADMLLGRAASQESS